MNVPITEPTNDNVIPDWEAKYKTAQEFLADRAGLLVINRFSFDQLCDELGLDETQQFYLERRVRSVQAVAKKMTENMIKGIVKYRNQHGTDDYWRNMGFDDLVDALNYQAIERYEKENPLV